MRRALHACSHAFGIVLGTELAPACPACSGLNGHNLTGELPKCFSRLTTVENL